MTTDTRKLTRRLAPIALFLVVCYNELTTTTPTLRSLREETDNTFVNNNINNIKRKKSSPPPPPIYWGMSCPLEVSSFSISSRDINNWINDNPLVVTEESYESFTQRAISARDLSLSHSTPNRVLNAINSGAFVGRKVVFVGDSLTRQNYISLGCLAGEEQILRHVTPFYPDRRKNGLFYDGRWEWNGDDGRGGGGGEVFYAPSAGQIYRYNWVEPPDGPIVSDGDDETLNWLESCRKDLPFEFETYSYGERRNSDGTSQTLERIQLSSQDVVFLNAGFHFYQEEGHANLLNLLQCMEDKGKNKFPHLVYVTSSVQHFDTQHNILTNESGERIKKCTDVVPSNPKLEQELKLYKGKIPIIGQDVDLVNRGDLHVIGEKTDCTHWFQPGIPDIFAAKAAEVVVKIAEGVDLMMEKKEKIPVIEEERPKPERVETPLVMEQQKEAIAGDNGEGDKIYQKYLEARTE